MMTQWINLPKIGIFFRAIERDDVWMVLQLLQGVHCSLKNGWNVVMLYAFHCHKFSIATVKRSTENHCELSFTKNLIFVVFNLADPVHLATKHAAVRTGWRSNKNHCWSRNDGRDKFAKILSLDRRLRWIFVMWWETGAALRHSAAADSVLQYQEM